MNKDGTKRKSAINNCPQCGSGDVRVCNVSLRPYCHECKYWGSINYSGVLADAIDDWNSK